MDQPKSPRQRQTAKLSADLIDRAHRVAGERRAAGDRSASASSVLTEWASRGAELSTNTASPKSVA